MTYAHKYQRNDACRPTFALCTLCEYADTKQAAFEECTDAGELGNKNVFEEPKNPTLQRHLTDNGSAAVFSRMRAQL